MRVLLTNHNLVDRGGAQLYLRDVALALQRRGHDPVAYAARLGDVAEELRAAGIPAVDRIDDAGPPPDLIHGHHHYETLIAALRFPTAPVISFCHGSEPWQDAPLHFPRVVRWVAVDEACRARLLEDGIAPESIEIILNFFDERRFAPGPPRPRVPKRALAFSNEIDEAHGLPVLREACGKLGIALDAVGLAAGRPHSDPGPLLAGYDIVFAKARAAIEAMASGAAVILCKPQTIGQLVTSGNFAELRPWNFGARTILRPLEVESVIGELRRYDAGDAAAVAHWAREDCGLDAAMERILALYQRVIGEARPCAPSEVEAAAAHYLERWSWKYTEHVDYRLQLASALRQLQALGEADRDLAAIRASATWRWSRAVLESWPLRRLLGPLLRSASCNDQHESGGSAP